MRSCLKDTPDAQEQERKFFACLKHSIQLRRNRRLTNTVTSVDVHILGDYETVNTSALPEIDDIERNLVENGFSRLPTGGEKSERPAKIDTEHRASIRAVHGQVNSKRAVFHT